MVEIGPGAGNNLQHYPLGAEWIGVEPDVRKHPVIRQRAVELGRSVRIERGRAERLGCTDDSVDAVVATFVLCSVVDPHAVLAEVRRVLRPGGRYVFVEHVAAPVGTWTRRAADAWTALTCWSDSGCRANRETDLAIARAGFGAVELRRYTLPGPLGTRVSHVSGTAHTSSGPAFRRPAAVSAIYEGA